MEFTNLFINFINNGLEIGGKVGGIKDEFGFLNWVLPTIRES